MATRIRGQETFLQLQVDGVTQVGSFAKVENFRITPRADLTDSPFLGETEDEPDVMHHGYDFSFTIHEQDNGAMELWNSIVEQLTTGTTLPTINVIAIKRYRDPAILPATEVLENCVMKLDSQDMGGRKDYVKSTFSGKCRTKRTS